MRWIWCRGFGGGMNWFLGALGVETVACWLQSKMDSSRVSLIRCRLNQQSHEAMHAANIKHLKNNQDVVYKGLLGFYKIQVFYNPGVFFPFTF